MASTRRNDTNAEDFEAELDEMLALLQDIDPMIPDEAIAMCMGFMSRCTEMWVYCIRNEGQARALRSFRTAQLQKLMDLLEYLFRGSSRMTEIRRQELEMSK